MTTPGAPMCSKRDMFHEDEYVTQQSDSHSQYSRVAHYTAPSRRTFALYRTFHGTSTANMNLSQVKYHDYPGSNRDIKLTPFFKIMRRQYL